MHPAAIGVRSKAWILSQCDVCAQRVLGRLDSGPPRGLFVHPPPPFVQGKEA